MLEFIVEYVIPIKCCRHLQVVFSEEASHEAVIEHALISVQGVMDDGGSFLYPVFLDFLQPFRCQIPI